MRERLHRRRRRVLGERLLRQRLRRSLWRRELTRGTGRLLCLLRRGLRIAQARLLRKRSLRLRSLRRRQSARGRLLWIGAVCIWVCGIGRRTIALRVRIMRIAARSVSAIGLLLAIGRRLSARCVAVRVRLMRRLLCGLLVLPLRHVFARPKLLRRAVVLVRILRLLRDLLLTRALTQLVHARIWGSRVRKA